jgi:hypothetical protein
VKETIMSGKQVLFGGLTALLAASLAATVVGAATLTQTVAFEAECLDLDTGALATGCREPRADEPAGDVWDVAVAYQADRAVHAVVAPNPAAEVEIAHLADRAFEGVTAADVEAATFTRDLVDEPFDASRVVLVRTDRGAVYKLGRPSESGDGLTFQYELLLPAP